MTKKSFESYKENPFEVKGVVRVNRNVKNNTELVVNKETGEMYELTKVKSQTTLVDEKPFRKVYEECLEPLKSFTIPALRLYCYILQNLPINNNYVRISVKYALEYCGYNESSKSSLYKGLTELLDKKIIAVSAKGDSHYWINTNLIFNGNRLTKYKENKNFED